MTHRRRLLVVIAILGSLVVGCGSETQDAKPTSEVVAPTGAPSTVVVPAASPTASVPAGALLFRADGNWASGLFVVNADGSGLSPLPSIADHEARLSPDNESLAYTRDGHIWISDADGSNARDITPEDSAAAFTSWSPDGSRILFGYFSESFSEYWAMRRDGTDRVMIVPRCQLFQGDCYRPQWSRDGASLLAEIPSAAPAGGSTELVILGIDGAIQRRLPASSDGWDEFAWSPDGATIAYVTGTHVGRGILAVIAPDGSNVRQIGSGDQLHSLAWSPDSTRIAFSVDVQARFRNQQSPPTAHWELRVAELASGATQVLVTSDGVGMIAWSPDGGKIAFTGDLGDSAYRGSQVYVIAASGGTPTNVSNGPWHDTFTRWSADGRSLIFRSDRDGRDGVYALDPSTGAASRITPLPSGARASEAPPPNSTGGCVPPGVLPTSGPLFACVSPGGSRLASVEQERLVITDVTTRGILATSAQDLVVAPSPPAWSRDEARVAFYANAGDVSWLYILDVESARSVALVPATVRGNSSPSIVWGSGDAYIYFSDGAFCRQGCTPGLLYRVRTDGSDLEQLTDLRVLTLFGFQP